MKINTTFLAAALGAALCATPAMAGTQAATHHERVPYGDLNLASADGQAQLQERLDRAALRACSQVRDNRTRNFLREYGTCLRETRKRVAVQVARLIEAERQLGG